MQLPERPPLPAEQEETNLAGYAVIRDPGRSSILGPRRKPRGAGWGNLAGAFYLVLRLSRKGQGLNQVDGCLGENRDYPFRRFQGRKAPVLLPRGNKFRKKGEGQLRNMGPL
jgi:hypothetical protein